MRNEELINRIFTFFYTIFHLPSSLIYILHVIFNSLYNVFNGTFNGFNLYEFMNEQVKDAEKFMSIRNYVDYSFWGILFIYINFIK